MNVDAKERKSKRRALKTSFAKRKLGSKIASKKIAPLVVPTTARGLEDDRLWVD